jgi:two-component system phosphate regulon sensor histidine kinase PhoR
LREANETLNAIRTGQVDALVVQTEDGPQLYTLKTADHTYRIFIEKMKEGAVTLDNRGIILYSNSQFAAMADLPLAKVIGLPIADLIPADSRNTFRAIIKQGWKSDSKGEIFLKNKNNELVPFLLSVTSLELDEGTALSVILTDLTLQKENQKQLQFKNEQLEEARLRAHKLNEGLEDTVKVRTKDLFLSREYFKFLADNIPVIIWTADTSGKLDYVNRRWYQYTGFDLDESKTRQNELVHPDDLEISSAEWRQAVEQKQKYEHEFRFKRKSDGQFRWHHAQAIPFKDEEGHITAWIGTSIDIDDQKKELEKKDEFISVASHELKTPLTSLKGYIQLMEFEKEQLPESFAQYIKKANDSINKLQNLINDLLDVSKIQSGRLEFPVDKFNLSHLVNECVDNCLHMYPGYSFETEVEKNIFVKGNADRLEQVLMNLISNAIKYSPDNNEIVVKLSREDGCVLVSVTDFGIGISKDQEKLIFDRFYRVNASKYFSTGLGVGLYISSEIIKAHNGHMHVESKLNKGSTFSFELPVSK